MKSLLERCEEQRHSQDGNHVVLDGPEWDAIKRGIDALAGMVGFVQLMRHRYEDFPTDGHRVIEAWAALNDLEAKRAE
jgi:hypothetical protein